MIGFVGTNAALGIGLGADAILAGYGEQLVEQIRISGGDAASMPRSEWSVDSGGISSSDVVTSPEVVDFMRRCNIHAIVPFKTNRHLASLTTASILASEPQLVRRLENKLELPAIAQAACVQIPRTKNTFIDDVFAASVSEFSASFSTPIVFQPATGYAGRMTVKISNDDDVDWLIANAAKSAGKLCEFIVGDALTVNAVVLDNEGNIAVGDVSRQLTGIVNCTTREFSSCGNEYSLEPASNVTQATRRVAAEIGLELSKRGFLGMFGIDVVATSSGDIVLIEVNARCTASLSLAAQLQAVSGEPTLFQAHCLAFGEGSASRHEVIEAYDPMVPRSPVTPASSLLLFNDSAGVATVGDALKPGVWSLGAAPTRLRDGCLLAELRSPSEFILLAEPGRTVSNEHELLRMVFSQGITRKSGVLVLDETVAETVEALRLRTGLVPSNERAAAVSPAR